MSRHYLVTGGAGFIGSHVVDRLLVDHRHVTVVDNLSSGLESNLPTGSAVNLVRKNLTDLEPRDISPAPHIIAHLAAIPSVTKSWQMAMATHEANLTNTLKVIELAKAWGCSRVVFASSAAVYGDAQQLPIKEDQAATPISPYGLQKIFSEDYLQLFSRQSGFECVALRLFNVYGSRQKPDSDYSGVISMFVDAVKSGRDIRIFGDGEQTRDFIYVKDVADAFYLAMNCAMQDADMLRFNVGLGRQTSINRLAQILLAKKHNCSTRVIYEPARIGDIRHSGADISLIRKKLKYDPITSIEAGLQELLAGT